MRKYGLTMLAGVASLAIAGTASAQTNIIRITGSTAFRKAVHIAIGDILNAGYTYGYAGSALSSAGQAEFRGSTKVGNYPVDIKTSFSGSVGGIQNLTRNLTVSTWLNGTNLTAGGTSGLTGPYDTPVTADVTMSDSFQSSTAYTSPQLAGALNNDGVVGVVPFQFVRNAGSPSSISNVTSLVAQALFGAGQINQSLFTGNNADESLQITLMGRDEDSGTRLESFAETGFGIFNAPFQYQPTISGTPGTGGVVTAYAPWPINTVNGTTYPVGHSGYSSGGSLASAMNTPGSQSIGGGSNTSFIAYLGINDASTVTLGQTLTFNGVAYSTSTVAEGQYTLWSYEHMYYRGTYSGNPQTIANQIAQQIHDVEAVQSGQLLSTMQVGRSVEGGVITSGSPY
ncbi:MAG TPA: hypothetical protein VMV72_00560 [Verrucomicrobiae bacterium]|nr:hypothetical protein [Verrucomicrobiae bacterium]